MEAMIQLAKSTMEEHQDSELKPMVKHWPAAIIPDVITHHFQPRKAYLLANQKKLPFFKPPTAEPSYSCYQPFSAYSYSAWSARSSRHVGSIPPRQIWIHVYLYDHWFIFAICSKSALYLQTWRDSQTDETDPREFSISWCQVLHDCRGLCVQFGIMQACVTFYVWQWSWYTI